MPIAKISDLFSEETHSEILNFIDDEIPKWPALPDTTELFSRVTYNTANLEHPFLVEGHKALVGPVSDFFGEAVTPSYALLARYDNAGSCPVHVDRRACRYTVGYMARCTSGNWPIFVASKESDFDELRLAGWDEMKGLLPGRPNGGCEEEVFEAFCESSGLDFNGGEWIKIDQKPGDGYMVSGILNWHYREKIPYGTADVLLFHFIPRD
jgi:hypothetical protein